MEDALKQKNTSFKKKIENFWYYYKTLVLIVFALLALAAMIIFLNSGKATSDLNISLTTAGALTEMDINFNEGLPGLIKDINGDGEANITISRQFITEDENDESTEAYLQTLEGQLAHKGATLFIADGITRDILLKKDAFCYLDEFFNIDEFGDRVMFRNEKPIAFSLKGSRVLKDMQFAYDDLYAFILFKRPEDANDPSSILEYENAVAVLSALMEQE